MGSPGSSVQLFVYIKQGGIAMYPLLLCSVLCIAIGIERVLVLSRAGRADASLLDKLRGLISGNQIGDAVDQCTRDDSPLSRVMHAALTLPKGAESQRQKALERAVARESGTLERYMSILATIGSVSPFIGLFGTVLGIMRAFHDIGAAGSAGGAVVASGIAEALITTATGLFVAVISVVAYNHLMTWAQSVITNTELNAEELVSIIGE
jgi:biopolymer transport protein ExbB